MTTMRRFPFDIAQLKVETEIRNAVGKRTRFHETCPKCFKQDHMRVVEVCDLYMPFKRLNVSCTSCSYVFPIRIDTRLQSSVLIPGVEEFTGRCLNSGNPCGSDCHTTPCNCKECINFSNVHNNIIFEGRCLVTGNLCGSDTRPVGRDCQCKECQRYTNEVHNLPTAKDACADLHNFLRGRPWLVAVGIGKDDILIVYATNVKKAEDSFTGELCGHLWRGYKVEVKMMGRPFMCNNS